MIGFKKEEVELNEVSDKVMSEGSMGRTRGV